MKCRSAGAVGQSTKKCDSDDQAVPDPVDRDDLDHLAVRAIRGVQLRCGLEKVNPSGLAEADSSVRPRRYSRYAMHHFRFRPSLSTRKSSANATNSSPPRHCSTHFSIEQWVAWLRRTNIGGFQESTMGEPAIKRPSPRPDPGPQVSFELLQ